MRDDDSIRGRFKRYVSVSSSLTQLAFKLAKYYYTETPEQGPQRAQEMKAILGELKGPLMKIAQLLATVPDLLPPEFAKELMQLQSLAPPMRGSFVTRRMRGELGENWEQKFQYFNKEPAAAASLGQVHYARTHDGQEVACKLQYPDMLSIVKADLHQLKLFFKALDYYGRAIQSDDIHQEIQDRLLEELDYTLEARHLKLYHLIHQHTPAVTIPQVIDELSTHRLLCMQWLQGRSLLQCIHLPLEERNIIAKRLFHAWYIPFYHYGVIHGDPHLGNYSITDDLSVNILDFGCIRKFPPSFVQGVVNLYHALKDGDEELAVEAYRQWGFDPISKELIQVLNQWAQFLYAPLMEDRVRSIDETKSGIYGREVAGKVYQDLQKIGGVKPPKEFVFMDRAAIGLGSVFLHLKAEINWYEEFQNILNSYNIDTLQKTQKEKFSLLGLKF